MIYIALLRGINVGGKKAIKMAELIKICDSLAFTQASTYLQSGNVIFDYETAESGFIENKIGKAILEKYNFEVNVIVRTIDEYTTIVSENPFILNPEIDVDKLHVTFLRDLPKEKDVNEIQIPKDDNELFVIKNREVYLYCPSGYGNTKLNNHAFEKKLKTSATTRNWKSTCAILDIAKGKNK